MCAVKTRTTRLVGAMLVTAGLACNLPAGTSEAPARSPQSGSGGGPDEPPQATRTEPREPATSAPTDPPSPTVTATQAPSPTAAPTPYGGGGRIAFLSNRDTEWFDAFAVELTEDGPSEVEKLTNNSGVFSMDGVTWRPDGGAITIELNGVELVASALSSISTVEGGEDRDLIYSESGVVYAQPVWSPDGTQLLFTQFDEQGSDLWVLDPETDDLRQLTHSSDHEFAGDWSPDGSILFLRSSDFGELNPRYRGEVVTMGEEGGEMTVLAEEMVAVNSLRYSPDGSRILISSDAGGNHDLFVMAADGSDLRQLTDSAASETSADWSPDGTQIVYQRGEGTGDFDLYIMDADGANPRPLITHPGYDGAPVWGPG